MSSDLLNGNIFRYYVLYWCLQVSYHNYIYIDSPPRRSPGRKELREEGVARCWSPVVSRGAAPHSELADGLGFHNWLPPGAHVSDGGAPLEAPVGATEGLEPPRIQPPVEPLGGCCWAPWPKCWRIKCTSESPGDSAKMVVFPKTQLFSAPWAWKKIQTVHGKNWNIL